MKIIQLFVLNSLFLTTFMLLLSSVFPGFHIPVFLIACAGLENQNVMHSLPTWLNELSGVGNKWETPKLQVKKSTVSLFSLVGGTHSIYIDAQMAFNSRTVQGLNTVKFHWSNEHFAHITCILTSYGFISTSLKVEGR